MIKPLAALLIFCIFPAANATTSTHEDLKARADKMKGQTLVFKGFYLGMPAADAQTLLNQYLNLERAPATPINTSQDSSAEKVSNPSSEEQKKDMFLTVLAHALGAEELAPQSTEPFAIYQGKDSLHVQRTPQERPFAVADSNGRIVAFELSRPIQDALWGLKNISTREFLQGFINAYDIPRLSSNQVDINANVFGATLNIGSQQTLRHRSEKGYELTYWGDTIIWDDEHRIFASITPAHTITIKVAPAVNFN